MKLTIYGNAEEISRVAMLLRNKGINFDISRAKTEGGASYYLADKIINRVLFVLRNTGRPMTIQELCLRVALRGNQSRRSLARMIDRANNLNMIEKKKIKKEGGGYRIMVSLPGEN